MNGPANPKKIGLALSGGAARGLAHIGVIRALEHAGIPIDIIAGTSAGAIIGASYAWDKDVARMTRDALEANWKRMTPLLDVCFPRTGLIKGRKIQDLIATYVGGEETEFKDLKLPFACVASDIDTGEEVVMDSGNVAEALRATISIPGIFTAAPYNGRYLVDGGLTTPVPVQTVRDMGADFVIAVNVNPDVTGRMGKNSRKRVLAGKPPNVFQVLTQTIYIATYSMAAAALATADVAIEPDMEDINVGDFNRGREIITTGREATEAAIPEITAKLGID